MKGTKQHEQNKTQCKRTRGRPYRSLGGAAHTWRATAAATLGPRPSAAGHPSPQHQLPPGRRPPHTPGPRCGNHVNTNHNPIRRLIDLAHDAGITHLTRTLTVVSIQTLMCRPPPLNHGLLHGSHNQTLRFPRALQSANTGWWSVDPALGLIAMLTTVVCSRGYGYARPSPRPDCNANHSGMPSHTDHLSACVPTRILNGMLHRW